MGMTPTKNLPDYIPLNRQESQNSDLFVPMDQNGGLNGYENKENDSELSEDIRKLIQSVTQVSSAGAWNGAGHQSAFPVVSIANGGSGQAQDHDMQDAPTTAEQFSEPKAESREQPLRETPIMIHTEAVVSNGSLSTTSPPPAIVVQPQFIIFGASEDDLSYIIPRKSIQNIPDLPLRHLAAKGAMAGPSMCLNNFDQLESMKRLKEYLDEKKYRPFKPQIPLEQVLPDGTTKAWEPSSKSVGALKAVKVTDATRDLFHREVDFYLFAKDIEFDELRQASLKNLMHNYPKSINSIWLLVESLFLASHPSDRVLRQHIVDLIYTNREELTAHKPYSQFMRQFLKVEGVFGEALLDAYIRASEESRRKIQQLSVKDPLARARSEKPIPTEPAAAAASAPSRKVSISTRASPPIRSDAGWPAEHLRPSDLPKLSEALLQGRLVIARKSGYGTLVRPGVARDRNRDFQFSGGEIMLVNPFESTSSAHNIVVYNSQGEKGDVLADLIGAVPSELGIHPRDREWGQLYQQPMVVPSPAVTSASTVVHPDREERLYREDRRRSMSPPRRHSRR